METLALQRNNNSSSIMFGQIFRDGQQVCVTGELPDCGNAPDISCVLAGTYLFSKYLSPTKGWVWITQDVPNRSNIELHALNTPLTESEGCIGVGNTYGKINGMDAIMNSKVTLAKMLEELPDQFYLTILNPKE